MKEFDMLRHYESIQVYLERDIALNERTIELGEYDTSLLEEHQKVLKERLEFTKQCIARITRERGMLI